MKPKNKSDTKQAYRLKRKRNTSRFQMFVDEARHQLTTAPPETTFLMLSCFADMNQQEKSRLQPEFVEHLVKQMAELPGKQEQMLNTLLEIGQGTTTEGKEDINAWIEPSIQQTQRESEGLTRNLCFLSKLIRKWYILTMKTEEI